MMLGRQIIAAGLAALCGTSRVAAQGFIAACTWQGAMLVGSYLGMYCNNDNWVLYSYEWTWFDTANCLANYRGNLVAYNSGNYIQSCLGCATHGSDQSFLLTCECYNSMTRGMDVASFDLNQVVWNYNGSLGCFDHIGIKSHAGPPGHGG